MPTIRKNLALPTIFARREPSVSGDLKAGGLDPIEAYPRIHDVVFYADRDMKRQIARDPYMTRKKVVVINCVRYRVEWLPNVSNIETLNVVEHRHSDGSWTRTRYNDSSLAYQVWLSLPRGDFARLIQRGRLTGEGHGR